MILLKAHYFLWFGSLAGVLPYVSIFGQHYSAASASNIGVLYTILPFTAVLAKPIFCSMADYFSLHKLVLVAAQILTLIGYGMLILTPFFSLGPLSWWYYCTGVFVANTSMGVVTSMTDSITMKEVSSGRSSYGVIRVWGTLGWGLMGLFAGGINDWNVLTQLPYLVPGLVMFIVVICIDIIVIVICFDEKSGYQVENTQGGSRDNHSSDNHHQPNGSAFTEISRVDSCEKCKGKTEKKGIWHRVGETFIWFPSLLYYCTIVFTCGLLTAFHWSFFYWFLESVQGKDTFLMGLCVIVQSFLGEVPFFLFSEKIVNRIGINHSLSITLLAIAVRYMSYGFFITEGHAYFVLIIEITQGPTFGLFYVVMTAIAQDYSLKAVLRNQDSSPLCHHHLERNRERQEDPLHFSSSMKTPEVGKGGEDAPIDSRSINDRNLHESSRQDDPREKTYATMQGIMSAVYEGAGLGVGALVAGHAIDGFGIHHAWLGAGLFALFVCICNILLHWNLNLCDSQAPLFASFCKKPRES